MDRAKSGKSGFQAYNTVIVALAATVHTILVFR
jgi:hypothetical protein